MRAKREEDTSKGKTVSWAQDAEKWKKGEVENNRGEGETREGKRREEVKTTQD